MRLTPEEAATARRRDMMRRLQIGGTGLALVALLVGLSTLLTGQAREDAATAQAQAQAAAAGGTAAADAPADPLTNLGVEPVASDAAAPPAPLAPAPAQPATAAPAAPVAQTPLVPDLEPDPQLRNAQPAR